MIIRANKHLNKRPFQHCVVLTLFLFHIGYLSAQEAITLDRRNDIALSPQASSLHDAVNYPVDGNKGVADISIPIYTVEYGGIRIPILLRYSTSSAKVDRRSHKRTI